MILKIVTRYVIVLISLLAVPIFAAVYLIFTRGAPAMRSHTFVMSVGIYLLIAPFATALFVIPRAVREYKSDHSSDHSDDER